MTRSILDHGEITMVRHVSCSLLYNLFFSQKFLVVSNFHMSRCDNFGHNLYPSKTVFKTEKYTILLNNLLHLLTKFCYLRARHCYYYHELSYKAYILPKIMVSLCTILHGHCGASLTSRPTNKKTNQ